MIKLSLHSFNWLAVVLALLAASPTASRAETVALPELAGNGFAPRILYIENPRFPRLSAAEIGQVVAHAARTVKAHFGVDMAVPADIPIKTIDPVFADLVANAPGYFGDLIGDFRNDAVDWDAVREMLIEQITSYDGALADQIAFVEPHLTAPLANRFIGGLADAVIETYRTRLRYWTQATLDDGYPIIGAVPGRDDLPLNEYGYWTLMAKLGVEAEIVLTNQLIASVEYIPVPVHTAIRGGITGGSTEYNPASALGATVWMSVAPFLMEDAQITALRGGKTYEREDALRYAGLLLAHEIGHLSLHLGHPWGNDACVMRPAEVLDFSAWEAKLDAAACPVGSEPEMTKGVLQIPVW